MINPWLLAIVANEQWQQGILLVWSYSELTYYISTAILNMVLFLVLTLMTTGKPLPILDFCRLFTIVWEWFHVQHTLAPESIESHLIPRNCGPLQWVCSPARLPTPPYLVWNPRYNFELFASLSPSFASFWQFKALTRCPVLVNHSILIH